MNLSKKFLPIFEVFYKFVLKCLNVLNWIFWTREYCFKALKCKNWLTNTNPLFWQSETNIETLQNFSVDIWVFYKFVLKSVKSLNQILWATEYWFKALKCQILSTNTKPFFWETKSKIETLQKFFPFLWVSNKFALKSVNSLNWILWTTECWFKA